MRSYFSCEHYWSGQSRCRQDVAIADVRDRDERIPCVVIDGITGTVPCDLVKIVAPKPNADAGAMVRGLAAMLSGCCPSCGEMMTGEVEVNGKVHAMPCRHVIRGAPRD